MGTLVSPAVGRVTSGYGPRTAPKAGASTFHKGVDIADHDDIIVSPADGIVSERAYNKISGNYVVVDHGNGVSTRHQHLAAFAVVKGERVTAGQRIGTEGKTGNVTGVHLHTEVHINGVQVNPTSWYAERGVTLGSAGSGTLESTPPATPAPQNVQGFSQSVANYQDSQNRFANAGLVVDGIDGPRTQAWAAWVGHAQSELNKWKTQLPKLSVDKDYGQKTHNRVKEMQSRNGRPVTGFLSNEDAAYMRKHGSSLPNRPATR